MFIRFNSFGGLARRMPWWQTGLLVLISLPLLLLLFPIALFGLYRMRKKMKEVEKQFEAFQQRAQTARRGPKRVQVEVLENPPVIDLPKGDYRSKSS